MFKVAVCIANGVDLDQAQHSVASDLGLHYLHRSAYLGLLRYYAFYIFQEVSFCFSGALHRSKFTNFCHDLI